MDTDFLVAALPGEIFEPYFNMTNDELAAIGAVKMIADRHPGFPCRVSLIDAAVGEEVILLPFAHHWTGSPYQASGPIFVRKSAKTACPAVNEIPKVLPHRLLSLRGYDARAMMVEAAVVEGANLSESLHQLLGNKKVEYVHVHNAKPGCFACAVRRA